jgi:hypothetical protein
VSGFFLALGKEVIKGALKKKKLSAEEEEFLKN